MFRKAHKNSWTADANANSPLGLANYCPLANNWGSFVGQQLLVNYAHFFYCWPNIVGQVLGAAARHGHRFTKGGRALESMR